jgi:uncharacterized protein YbaR (Trm112 family)
MAEPKTLAEIEERINTVDAKIAELLASPEQAATLVAGGVTVNVPQYIQMLKEERDLWMRRRDSIPWLLDSDVEGVQ